MLDNGGGAPVPFEIDQQAAVLAGGDLGRLLGVVGQVVDIECCNEVAMLVSRWT